MVDPMAGSQPNLSLTLGSGETLDVREFAVEEGISRLFDVRLTAVSPSVDVDFEAAIGMAARFEIRRTSSVDGQTRHWGGVCAELEQILVEDEGLSTYAVRIVPKLWMLGQRRNYRVFQDLSELEVALQVLGGWGIQPQLRLDAASYTARRYRVQYAETDLAFVSRLLEDIGVSYFFEQAEDETALVLADAPNRGEARTALPFVSKPNERIKEEYVTAVTVRRQVRPGRYTQSDVDWRKPLDYPLAASASKGGPAEVGLERYHHNYGSFLWKGQGGDTPVADDRGAARTSEAGGAKQVQKRLDAHRVDGRVCRFRTTALDLRPGQVMTVASHPRAELGAPLLVIAGKLTGSPTTDWDHACEAVFTDVDFRPALATPKPRTAGVESATVTGPAGEEIHTDEFGRVRLHFHWDREGAADESSSCWIPVSQPWAGAGMGAITLPRVGQEVIVDFLGGDPDRPVVLGSVFTTTMPPPYELPRYKMVSGLRSETYPRPRASSPAGMGGGPGATGGGVLATRLGGAPGAAPQVPGTGPQVQVPSTSQPGMFGGLKATPDQLHDQVQRLKSKGPDGVDHKKHANGLVFDDKAKQESVYLQAQKDLRFVAKNDLTGSVGANRTWIVVGGNDYEEIAAGYQMTMVKLGRTVQVSGDQAHIVKGNATFHTEKNHALVAKESIFSDAVTGGQRLRAAAGLALECPLAEPKSTLLITPTAIVIDAPEVYINPGAEMMAAIRAGKTPQEAAKEQAERKKKRDDASKKAAAAANRPAPLTEDQRERMNKGRG